MSKEQMRQEKLYQATMSMVRKMLAEGLITEEEYRQIDTMFLAKYRPLFGTLCSEIWLTLQPFRVMYGSMKGACFNARI